VSVVSVTAADRDRYRQQHTSRREDGDGADEQKKGYEAS
jgi:hypothetical protein